MAYAVNCNITLADFGLLEQDRKPTSAHECLIHLGKPMFSSVPARPLSPATVTCDEKAHKRDASPEHMFAQQHKMRNLGTALHTHGRLLPRGQQ